MMKFTLSALWNLTDESPKTCSVFLSLGGMELFMKVLQIFEGKPGVLLFLMNGECEQPFFLSKSFSVKESIYPILIETLIFLKETDPLRRKC